MRKFSEIASNCLLHVPLLFPFLNDANSWPKVTACLKLKLIQVSKCLQNLIRNKTQNEVSTHALFTMRRLFQNIEADSVRLVLRLEMLKEDIHCLYLLGKFKTSQHDHLVATTVAVVNRVHGPKRILVESSEGCGGRDKHLGAKKRPFGFFKL